MSTKTHARIEAVNDFVVKFANVNGSGSASANELFARAILRMGVPVSPRNIFPSNIQGLPTWYEVRVAEKGWQGRRGGIDLMVAMNPQTWNQDLKEIEPGGYVFYDSTKALAPSKFRDDIHVIGLPLTEITNSTYSDPRARQLFKNIIALGALAFPFADEIQDFVQSHSKVFVIEQNRDAQMKTLLVNEAHINPASLVSILHYDGTPISAAIIEACYELDVQPHRLAKLSGIGCSSKTPDYFLGNSHGFNTVHGRMLRGLSPPHAMRSSSLGSTPQHAVPGACRQPAVVRPSCR